MRFEDISGQDRAVNILRGQLDNDRIAHAYIFLGPEGVGRKKTALELAAALNCEKGAGREAPCGECAPCVKVTRMVHPDVHVVDYAWQAKILEKEIPESGKSIIKIDTVRAIQKEMSLKIYEGRYRVFIVDNAETMTRDSANCLLKTLEEPSRNSVIILLAATVEMFPRTVVSRCRQVKFCALEEGFISSYLVRNAGADRRRSAQVARLSRGSLGTALQLNESYDEPFGVSMTMELWDRLRNEDIAGAEIISICNGMNKNRDASGKFVSFLLCLAREDLVGGLTRKSREAVDVILKTMNSLRYNVNLRVTMSSMLLQLKEIYSAGSG